MSLGVDISIQRIIVLAMLLGFGSSPALACSCGNSTPIDRTVQKYSERAVFTARIVQLMGKIHDWDGKRYSDVALAIVHERYWGLPWYWPKVVVLDGKYPCDIAMSEGDEYLVSGRRMRYGVLDVALCSRTTPLRMAQVDLRTLDGSHCSAPGGTILGKLFAPTDQNCCADAARQPPLVASHPRAQGETLQSARHPEQGNGSGFA